MQFCGNDITRSTRNIVSFGRCRFPVRAMTSFAFHKRRSQMWLPALRLPRPKHGTISLSISPYEFVRNHLTKNPVNLQIFILNTTQTNMAVGPWKHLFGWKEAKYRLALYFSGVIYRCMSKAPFTVGKLHFLAISMVHFLINESFRFKMAEYVGFLAQRSLDMLAWRGQIPTCRSDMRPMWSGQKYICIVYFLWKMEAILWGDICKLFSCSNL